MRTLVLYFTWAAIRLRKRKPTVLLENAEIRVLTLLTVVTSGLRTVGGGLTLQ